MVIPVYVTRKSGDGVIGTLSMNAYCVILAMFLIWINIVVWSVVGFIVAFRVVF